MENKPRWITRVIKRIVFLAGVIYLAILMGAIVIFCSSPRDSNEIVAKQILVDASARERAQPGVQSLEPFEKNGYRFSATRDAAANTFEMKAEPIDASNFPGTGTMSFLITEEGNLRYLRGGTAPTRDDPTAKGMIDSRWWAWR